MNTRLRLHVRSQYFSQIIVNNQSNPRQLFHGINTFLKGSSSSSIPITANLCDRFLDFFYSKIDKARSCMSTISVSADFALNSIQFSGAPLSNCFHTLLNFSEQRSFINEGCHLHS